MGAAPSTEVLRAAPFCPTRSGAGRVLALIPVTEEFFPSPDVPLFVQFYEARTDPYVRYYLRNHCFYPHNTSLGGNSADENDTNGVRLDQIPPAMCTRKEYYDWCMSAVGRNRRYHTNAELLQDYNAVPSRRHLIRPVPCAVVFQYDDEYNAPEGCVSLGDKVVRVIGGIGCLENSPESTSGGGGSNQDEAELTLELTMFVRKSAGDHNMVRVMLLSAWLLHEHCVKICGLPCVPLLSVTLRGLKTNIPFLCFLREMRYRVGLLQGNTAKHCTWIDGAFICSCFTASHASELCEAFAHHYQLLLNAKSRVKMDTALLPVANRLQPAQDGGDVSVSADMEDTVSFTRMPSSGRFKKQSFTLRGVIDTANTVIPEMGRGTEDVYLVCTDATVRIERSEDGTVSKDSLDHDGGEAMVLQAAPLKVKRGDVLRFFPDDAAARQPSNSHCMTDTITTPLGCDKTFGKDTTCEGELRRGTWIVDTTVNLENVLLALVHDECKNAREAPASDPHWLRCKETGDLVCDGNFYIWYFERGGVTYYYGTLPKFANRLKKRHDTQRRRPPITATLTSDAATAEAASAAVAATSRCDEAAQFPATTDALQNELRPQGGPLMGHKDLFEKQGDTAAQQFPAIVGNVSHTTPFFDHTALPSVDVMQQHYTEGSRFMLVQPAMPYNSVSGGSAGAPFTAAQMPYYQSGINNCAVYPSTTSSLLHCMQPVHPLQLQCLSPMQPMQYVPWMQPLQQTPAAMYAYFNPAAPQTQPQQLQPVPFMHLRPPAAA
ncbi:hypothetical protein DQ04_01571110 [Trypanosoma grayi]|uniref:hypothetical protein n=1 Tax=Trypanosoma grayi TaxID=71804 RepID=UPI0004F40A2C|nr:hypothetical protein DQ04_01571110 [Trypanosoma grayi]KEG12628.1 hypothetical protein DQ04_01571110 [Trypanosoma grayi]